MPDVLEGLQTNFAKSDTYPVDGRGVGYSMGFFSAKHLGTGQFYLMTIMDKAGQPFDGGKTYRLTCPRMRQLSFTGQRLPMIARRMGLFATCTVEPFI